ncbi:MAG: UDP-N-acetylmuramoyl-L-alanyl-D-glutamate--2,6-diaminopimelate ligase [Spirochaetales bacterium]|nr:MAG: UDP-N-acetylmuramoyl-L-alanyl-D-glutamate--2,6-diaminopimelate ligase [Spirochaetales bacterium]
MICALSKIIAPLEILETRGDASVPIHGLAYDSREATAGYLFFALPGLHVDGHEYIEAALDRGAVAIIHERELSAYHPGVCYVRVVDSRFAMSPVSDAFRGSPSRSLAVIGITGTEGKSTTVWLVYRLLDLAGKKAGFISTVAYNTGNGVLPNPAHQTTPEATSIHEKLAAMVGNGLEYAVVESSSHGLSPRYNRLGNVLFDVGVMTNVRHEHLEFHGTWERYRDDKANLFRLLDANDHTKTIAGLHVCVPAFGVTCVDDGSTDYFRAATAMPVYTYSMKSPGAADLWAQDIRADDLGATFSIAEADSARHEARINLPGDFNVENVLAAILTVSRLCGIPVANLAPLLPRLEPVLGRMTRIDSGQPFQVLVDYAHTPSSFETILAPLAERSKGKLICVFGSGGERDVQKRPEQGRIAAKYCQVVILADEDPRGEDPMALLEDIAAGCTDLPRENRLFLIPDRAKAIRTALSLASPGDAVLLLGKGHEGTIDYQSGSIPWNEIEEAKRALSEIGYCGGKF